MPEVVLVAEAFAKTNRDLRVIGRRPDGYHELDTIFQSIDLADRLEIRESSALELECDDPALPSGPGNLVHLAATELARAFGVRARARIRLWKRIPAGGGLGGGSSDAAVALALLARLWKLDADIEALLPIARGLGSDVPFFLYGGAARGTGRGDIIRPLPDEDPRRILLVVPPFSIATAGVYGRFGPDPSRPAAAETSGNRYFGINDLASAVLEAQPEMALYMKEIVRAFPDCQISGSGSSIVAAMPGGSETALPDLRNSLPDAKVYVLRTVPRPEYRRRSGLDAFGMPKEAMER